MHVIELTMQLQFLIFSMKKIGKIMAYKTIVAGRLL